VTLITTLVTIAAINFILVYDFNPGEDQLEVGSVASRSILAPRAIDYISQIQTDQERARAAASVPEIYDPPDLNVAREQLAWGGQVLDYIDAVRHDDYATPADQADWLIQIPDLSIAPSVVSTTLILNDAQWEVVEAETLMVLEQAMREEIRQDQLIEARREIPRLVSIDVPPDHEAIVGSLAKGFLRPNTSLNTEATERARSEAMESVAPVSRSLEKGEAILREGDVVTALDLEALEAAGFRSIRRDWQEIAATSAFALIAVLGAYIYLLRIRPALWGKSKQMLIIGFMMIALMLLARFAIPNHTLLPYLIPLAAVSMLITILIDVHVAIVITISLSLLLGFLGGESFELSIFFLTGGLTACLAIYRLDRLNNFLRTGIFVSLANMAIVLIFRLLSMESDTMGMIQLAGMALLNGVLSTSLTLAGFFVLSNVLGITTVFQLLELARPNHPLLQQLALKAPGTYHHSVIVGSLAERAAEAVGADPLLARIGSYYHDIGKVLRPYFFRENQANSANVHERLDPETSAKIVISHVKDGLDLARKYDLPKSVQDIIGQHHNSSLTAYFYNQAQEESGSEQIDEANFRYPGPKPHSREAAIVMLADAAEAAVRSDHPQDEKEIDSLVHQIIQQRLVAGELSECDLTLLDLDRIRDSFVVILQGIFHPRIPYPKQDALPPVQEGAAE
jgi:putative nucleotidyltransferase with HDIG domain